ncbi:Uncharacterised protein [Salmonella enterica subsp. enterica serovar Typhi]|nr:Uncharacterised protein [Salmonella enterica subsp. enterica serovar Typhi]CHL16452.1 Uncharacterised protein [Salmonella enterica subsp. enterica serovar Typhi]CRK07971.1 Uncharacterised protein [Salmonella enterica subsp. enterica serovar Typhi]
MRKNDNRVGLFGRLALHQLLNASHVVVVEMNVKAKMHECASHVAGDLREEVGENAVTGNIERHTNKGIDAALHQA